MIVTVALTSLDGLWEVRVLPVTFGQTKEYVVGSREGHDEVARGSVVDQQAHTTAS